MPRWPKNLFLVLVPSVRTCVQSTISWESIPAARQRASLLKTASSDLFPLGVSTGDCTCGEKEAFSYPPPDVLGRRSGNCTQPAAATFLLSLSTTTAKLRNLQDALLHQ